MASELLEGMYRALTGRRHTDERTPFGELLADLVDMAGSGRAAAALLGISPTTLYRWRAGRQRPKMGRGVLARAIRRGRLSRALEAAVRRKERTLRITGWITISRDRRARTINVGMHFPTRTIGNILNAWLAADDDRADRLLWSAIDRYYVQDLEIDEIEGVEFR